MTRKHHAFLEFKSFFIIGQELKDISHGLINNRQRLAILASNSSIAKTIAEILHIAKHLHKASIVRGFCVRRSKETILFFN